MKTDSFPISETDATNAVPEYFRWPVIDSGIFISCWSPPLWNCSPENKGNPHRWNRQDLQNDFEPPYWVNCDLSVLDNFESRDYKFKDVFKDKACIWN